MLGHSSIAVTGDIYGHTPMTRRRPRWTAGARCSDCERQNRTSAYPLIGDYTPFI